MKHIIPAVEERYCDLCGADAKDDMYWDVSYPILAANAYDDGCAHIAWRTIIRYRDIDLCSDCADKVLRVKGSMGTDWDKPGHPETVLNLGIRGEETEA